MIDYIIKGKGGLKSSLEIGAKAKSGANLTVWSWLKEKQLSQ